MCGFVAQKSLGRKEKYERVKQLMEIMEEIRAEERERKKNKKKHGESKSKRKRSRDE